MPVKLYGMPSKPTIGKSIQNKAREVLSISKLQNNFTKINGLSENLIDIGNNSVNLLSQTQQTTSYMDERKPHSIM